MNTKFLIEVKDLSGKNYYFRTTAIDENYAISTVATILSIPNHSSDRFMKVYSDSDCRYGEFYIDRTKIIGYRIVLDLTAT